MSTSTRTCLVPPARTDELPPWRDLDESLWRAWVAKGRDRDEQGRLKRLNIVKWISIVTLVSAAGWWPLLATYPVAIRFVAAAGALFVMADLIHARRYAFGAVFGMLAILLNPVTPLPDLAFDSLRGIALVSAIPFAASIPWRGKGGRG
jgi:hypothetical protein